MGRGSSSPSFRTTWVGQLWLDRLQLAGGLPAIANKKFRTRHQASRLA